MYIGHIDYGTNNYVKQKKILFFSSEVPTPHYVMGIMLPQDPHPQQKALFAHRTMNLCAALLGLIC